MSHIIGGKSTTKDNRLLLFIVLHKSVYRCTYTLSATNLTDLKRRFYFVAGIQNLNHPDLFKILHQDRGPEITCG